jgi:hypothetical protein
MVLSFLLILGILLLQGNLQAYLLAYLLVLLQFINILSS